VNEKKLLIVCDSKDEGVRYMKYLVEKLTLSPCKSTDFGFVYDAEIAKSMGRNIPFVVSQLDWGKDGYDVVKMYNLCDMLLVRMCKVIGESDIAECFEFCSGENINKESE